MAHIGDGSSLGFDRSGPLVVATARKSCKAFLSQQYRQSIDTNCVTGAGQLWLDVIDREIVLAHSHGQFSDPVSRRCFLGAASDLLKESDTLGSIVPELMTEDAKSSGRVPKASGDLFGRHPFNEVAS